MATNSTSLAGGRVLQGDTEIYVVSITPENFGIHDFKISPYCNRLLYYIDFLLRFSAWDTTSLVNYEKDMETDVKRSVV